MNSGSLTSRDWWKTIKQFMHPSQAKTSHVPSLFDEGKDILILDETEKANLLDYFFASQSSVDDLGKSLPANYYPAPYVTLDFIEVTPEEVYKVLKNLNIGKASGPDGIHNRILCDGAAQLAYPLCDLFNASLNLCAVPSSWKMSNVCPIFKGGDPSILPNYRPVSLLNTIEKVLEKIIFNHVFSYLSQSNFFYSVSIWFFAW